MLNLLYMLSAGDFDFVLGMRQDPFWVSATIALSALVAVGYIVIAINWYFQSKLARHAESRATLKRLRNIALCCGICGTTFYLTDMPWIVWRFYDVCLVVFAWSAWSFVWRMRGLSLVDERLKQVDELERAAVRYREIAELLPQVVWTATAHGVIDYCNEVWRDYAGGGSAADRTWLDAVHPDDRPRVLSIWNAALTARQAVHFEARLEGRDGRCRSFLIRATPIRQGVAVKWLGACADIEDQKRLAAEKEMQARQKAFFLNALSHDLRAPLHNVLLNAQLLKMSSAAGEPPDAEALAMIVDNSVAAGDLVARLLDFAKVGAEDQNVIEPVSLPALLTQIVRRYAPLAEQKGLYLRKQEVSGIHGTDPAAAGAGAAAALRVPTDRLKLERIISNLVENAVKYTPRGGVELEIATGTDAGGGGGTGNASGANGAGSAGGGAMGGELIIRVRDSGIGIPHDKVPYLFDEFYQVNNYERDRSKGFGMGLAICRSLARHIGADIRLVSTGDTGSCFEVILGANTRVNATVNGEGRTDVGEQQQQQQSQQQPQQPLGPDRGGRPLGSPGDRNDPASAGLCRI
jgi:PAS domain S-box-containing protein